MRDAFRTKLHTTLSIEAQFVRTTCPRDDAGIPQFRVLLHDLSDPETGMVFCDHIWLAYEPIWGVVRPKEGDYVIFRATVTAYQSGYEVRRFNYGLTHVTHLRLTYGPARQLRRRIASRP